jgi:ADP-ribose pyrophosphatase YjhB (NUDIX family)
MARESEINFCPRCGAVLERQVRFGRERPACPACHWIHFSDPKVAAAVLVEQGGRVLLVRRINDPYRGLWSLPAGFVDADEDPARAAERECLDETGLTVHVTQVAQVIAGAHERGADFPIVYLAEVQSGELHAGDDADQVEWFPRDDLPELAFRATQSALKKK